MPTRHPGRARAFLEIPALVLAVSVSACAGPPGGAPDPDETGGTGDESMGGSGGGGGTTGSGTGGHTGTGGKGSTGGSSGSGGSGGTAGSGGSGGGSGDNADAGAGTGGSSGKDAGSAAATFTQVYEQIMSQTPAVPASSCTVGPCHGTPGAIKARAKIDMASKDKAWTGVMKLVVPKSPATSKLYTELSTGKMPEKKPKLPANLIKLVADWINAGAMND
jgi:hypothetical protein